ncbi:MAG TPA: hypothetical protein VFS34_09250 [Thermoanaerobaculia bacterium]|nr:hypothetical protein [Thermoanaerobaculia bacterium]
MHVLGWVLMGGAVGIVSNLVFSSRDPNGTLAAPLLGIMGAIIGGVAAGSSGMAVAGAIGLVALFGISASRSPIAPPLR